MLRISCVLAGLVICVAATGATAQDVESDYGRAIAGCRSQGAHDVWPIRGRYIPGFQCEGWPAYYVIGVRAVSLKARYHSNLPAAICADDKPVCVIPDR
jgi:hypothetical protein